MIEGVDGMKNLDKNKGDEDSNLDVQTLLDRILRLKTLLRDANQRSENPIENLDELLGEDSTAVKWKKAAHMFKEELEKLRNESDIKRKHYNKKPYPHFLILRGPDLSVVLPNIFYIFRLEQ